VREYGERRSLTIFGEFSDRLRHPGHRIVFVQVTSPFCPGLLRWVQMSASAQCGATDATAPLPATPFMAGCGAVCGSRRTFGRSRLGRMGDGPDKADPFPRHRRGGQRRLLASRHQAATAATQANLSFSILCLSQPAGCLPGAASSAHQSWPVFGMPTLPQSEPPARVRCPSPR